ncbi:MAG: response regulator transcription factor [Bacteroidales bacterium]|nr:response regulator transcription factor [Bacteroidales bacterium]
MAKIKILLVEDSTYVEVALQNRLTAMNFDIASVVATPKMAIDFLETNKVDIVLMDIFATEKYTGNDATNDIHSRFSIPVVLLNGDDKNNLNKLKDSYAKLIMHKPLNDNELAFNIRASIIGSENKGTASFAIQKKYIFVKADYRLNKIRLDDIYYIEASKDYVTIHTTNNSYTVHVTMKDIEAELPSKDFVRTHRSFIVNIDKIFSIKYPDILIEDKMKTIQIGGLYRKKLMQLIDVV